MLLSQNDASVAQAKLSSNKLGDPETEIEYGQPRIALVSSCASATRGHRAIGHRMIEAAQLAGFHLISPLVMPFDSSTRERLQEARSQAHEAGSPLLIMTDFPDLPQSTYLNEIMRTADVSIYLSMVSSTHYRSALSHAIQFTEHDVVISIENGAVRYKRGATGERVTCQTADFSIAPLIQRIPECTTLDVRIWSEAIASARRAQHPTAPNHNGPVFLWLRAGFPEEMTKLGKWLHHRFASCHFDDTAVTIIDSADLEARLRAALLQCSEDELDRPGVNGVVRFARLADQVIASPGYSAFWELYALGVNVPGENSGSRIHMWCKLERPVEAIDARLSLLKKPDLVANSSASALTVDHQAGVKQLARILKVIGHNPDGYRKQTENH